MSKTTSSWKTFSVKKGTFSISSSAFNPNLFRFSEKKLQQSWQKCISYVQRTFRGKQTFWKNRTYLIFTDFEPVAFDIWQEASIELQKLRIICWGNLLRINFCFEKYLVTELLSDCERKVFGLIFKKTSDVSRGKFPRQKNLIKNHVFLGLCRSLFRKIGRNVLIRCSKPQFNCPEVLDSWKNCF